MIKEPILFDEYNRKTKHENISFIHKNTRKLIGSSLVFLWLISLFSCNKPWPEDIKSKLEIANFLEVRDVIVSINGEYTYNNIIDCTVSKLQQKYPDYADYEKEVQENRQAIAEMTLPCFINSLGNNTDIIWAFIEKNPSYITMKSELSNKQIQLFKKIFLEQFKIHYGDMTGFFKQSIHSPESIEYKIADISYESGKAVRELIEQENKQLEEMESLFDDSFYSYGTLTFVNNSNKKLSLCLGYYYQGSRWSGWTSNGWWNIEPGEKININIPSNSGYLNRYFYYYAKGDNVEYSGKDNFVVSSKAFKIPNADKIKADDFSDFYYLSKFKKVDIGAHNIYSNYTYSFN